MKICILVNGEKNAIFGRRVRQFHHYVSFFRDAIILYRSNLYRFFSIFYFVFNLIRIKPRLVYVEAVAFSGCVAVALLKPFLHFKYIISTGDDYHHIIKQLYGSFLGFFAGVLEDVTYNIADIIITLSPYQKDCLISRGYKKVFCIMQGVDTEKVKPLKVDELKRKLKLEGFLTIGLVGSIVWHKRYNYSYGWEIVEIIKILKEKPVKALVVGGGNGLIKLKKQAKSYGISDRVVFTGRVSYDDIPSYINCMDICFSTQSNNMVGRMRIPIKLVEYLACGKFVISTDVGYAQTILKNTGALIPYKGIKDDTYPISAAKIIEEILLDRFILHKAKTGIDIAKNEFDFRILSRRLEDIITKI